MFPKKRWMNKEEKKLQKEPDRKKLLKRLDTVFSLYIRLRDSDNNGICKCITCGTPHFWNDGDAGHFMSRDRMATRHNEKNVNFQCIPCNRFKSGKQYEHGIAIDKKYGAGTADMLLKLSSVSSCKLDVFWLDYKIKEYRKKIKEIKLNKNIVFWLDYKIKESRKKIKKLN